MKTIKKLLAVMLICIQTLQFSMVPNVLAEETATTPGTEQTSDTAVEVTAPSAILMEMTTVQYYTKKMRILHDHRQVSRKS